MRTTIILMLSLATSMQVPLPLDAQTADLVLSGGKIATVDEGNSVVEALAVRKNTIVAVGSSKEIAKHIGPNTRVIDISERLAIPGFIEGHGHFLGMGDAQMILDLKGNATWSDVVTQVAQAATTTPAGDWIIGRGWHQSKWKRKPAPNVKGYPTHASLSAMTPKHPVLLYHASGHMVFANARAMELARVTAQTPDPRGGEILHDEQGEPIGVFRETAQGLFDRAQQSSQRNESAEQGEQRFQRMIDLATRECLENGVTSFQDAGTSIPTIDRFIQLADAGKLKVRLWVMIREPNARLARQLAGYRMIGRGNEHLTVRGIKRSIDGALGPHGAWLLEPYDDLPRSIGLNTATIESIRETARLARKHNFQLCVHAIGDRANRTTLDLFEEAFANDETGVQRRWRVEHAQHLHPEDIPRFEQLGVVASMQGIHCTSDAPFVIQRLGQRRAGQGAYVWQSLIKSGAVVCNGSDVPVEDIDPLESFYASVTRKLDSGVEFFPEQCMTREQALRSYTINAAYAAFEEDRKGSLEVGKLADIVVLSKDILSIPDNEIRSTRVLFTIVGGKVLFEAAD